MDERTPSSTADLKLESLSKDELIDLVKLSSRMILAVDGFWYLSVKELAGNDKALERDNWVWDKVMKFYVDELARLLNVRGRDVADYMKVMNPRPEALHIEERVEILNRNDAIRTVTYCPTIAALEKEGEGRDAIHCSATCSAMRSKHSKLFNPAIDVTCLKIPPRNSKDDIFCRFRYKIQRSSARCLLSLRDTIQTNLSPETVGAPNREGQYSCTLELPVDRCHFSAQKRAPQPRDSI